MNETLLEELIEETKKENEEWGIVERDGITLDEKIKHYITKFTKYMNTKPKFVIDDVSGNKIYLINKSTYDIFSESIVANVRKFQDGSIQLVIIN